jgi:hypothetical protein
MRYEHFTTRAAADARVQELKAQGRQAYALTMRADFHEVRTWGL